MSFLEEEKKRSKIAYMAETEREKKTSISLQNTA